MRNSPLRLAFMASLLVSPVAAALSEFGIEGMGRVSSPANEARATLSADGQRIVFASDRDGGSGGWDLWQATLEQGRWSIPQSLALNGSSDELDPFLSADGRWLYFASNRKGGAGFDLYRAPVDGSTYGEPERLPNTVNSAADERSPALDLQGTTLLFVRSPPHQPGQLLRARRDAQNRFAVIEPIRLDTDHPPLLLDASWLGDGRALVYAAGEPGSKEHSRLWLAQCRDGAYRDPQPLALSFNTGDGRSRGAVADASKPGELLVTGSARSPRAGGLDLYRMKTPLIDGDSSCR
jgi:hypothetical protein